MTESGQRQPPLVAHIIYSLSTGGLENGLVNIINRMPPGRYRHVIVCITTADEFSRRITASDVQVVQMYKRPGHDIRFYWRLWRLLRQLRPAIVHSRNLAALECQLCSVGLPGVKRVHGEHGREITDVDGSNRKYLALRRLLRPLIHRYIAVSRDLQTWLVERVGARPERVKQIYNGVDYHRFTPGTVKPLALLPRQWQGPDGILIVGTVGRLTPVKDQRTLVRAVAALWDTDPALAGSVRLVIVGDGPLRGELEQLVAELGLADAVWLAGDRDDVPGLLALMDVFALPSLGEGVSNTVLEAMASGLPVVATAVGGNRELVREGESGSLVPVGDAQALARALATLLRDDAERGRQGDNARRRVCEEFDWQRAVGEYLDVYNNLTGAR